MTRTALATGASGFDWGTLPLHADDLAATSWSSATSVTDYVLGTPQDNREPRYPGERPESSFVVLGSRVHAVRPASEGCGWQVRPDDRAGEPVDLDEWLIDHGQVPLADRLASLGYGSNLSPTQVKVYAGDTAVVVLRALTIGIASAYCTSKRNDSQYPAGITAADASRVEVHGIVLLDPSRLHRLDSKEGQGSTYSRSLIAGRGLPIAAVLENGTVVENGLPVYLQDSRRLGQADGRPVLLADVEQRAYASMLHRDETVDHGLMAERLKGLPALDASPMPVFVYGTLRPGESRWPSITALVDHHEPTSLQGHRFDTGYGFPALVLDHPQATDVDGWLLHPRQGTHHDLMRQLDLIEGHPDLYARHLVRVDDGRLAWTYLWNGDR